MRYSIFPSFHYIQTDKLLNWLTTLNDDLDGGTLPVPLAVWGGHLIVLKGGIWYKRTDSNVTEVLLAREGGSVSLAERAAYVLLIAAQTKAYGDPAVVRQADSVFAKVTERCYYNLSLRHLPYYYAYYTEVTGTRRPVCAVGFDRNGKAYFKESDTWVSADGEVIQQEPELVFTLPATGERQ
jgi:hypothetical protein